MTQRRQDRYISKPLESFDRFVIDAVEQFGLAAEVTYYGCTNPARAEEVRRGLRRAGKHLDVAVKAYTADCPGCPEGGPDCRHHILFTCYDMEAARDYMKRKAEALGWKAGR